MFRLIPQQMVKEHFDLYTAASRPTRNQEFNVTLALKTASGHRMCCDLVVED